MYATHAPLPETQDHSHSPPDLGPAVDGGHAPCRRHRREVAGLAIM